MSNTGEKGRYQLQEENKELKYLLWDLKQKFNQLVEKNKQATEENFVTSMSAKVENNFLYGYIDNLNETITTLRFVIDSMTKEKQALEKEIEELNEKMLAPFKFLA
jgi:predicted  nucleic acid-binding Zn-ribbon protein